MTAKQYLMQYRQALKELRCKEAERQSLLDHATNISPSTQGGTPVPGNITDKTGNGGTSLAALDSVIESEIKALEDKLIDIRDTISQISEPTERDLLTYYYICCYTWERTAAEMGYTFVHVVKNLHPAALKSISTVMVKKNIE